MEAVTVAGQHCARHTRVAAVPAVEVPPVPQGWMNRVVQQVWQLVARPELPDAERCIAIMRNGQRCSAHRRPRSERCGTHKHWTPLVQCAAIKRDGRRCVVHALPGRTMCGTHKAQEPEAPAVPAPAPAPAPADPEVPSCRVLISSRSSRMYGLPCGQRTHLREIPAGPGAQPEFCCGMHQHKRATQLRRQWVELDLQSATAVVEEVGGGNRIVQNIVTFMRAVPMTVYSTDLALARQESMRRARAAMALWAAEVLRRPAANAPVLQGLARFTNDRQNVHTAEANAIVAEANKELADAVPIEGSLKLIRTRFSERNFGTLALRGQVYKDMKKWYTDRQVMRAVGQMEVNDFAYKRLLDKVWGLIQKSKHKDDLEQRLWEEAVDSLGMCTQGHMTRLANVLQGFEEAAEAPKVEIPKGERLQTAMAQIAELPQNERESAARRVFAELEIPEDRQGSWLEALEVA